MQIRLTQMLTANDPVEEREDQDVHPEHASQERERERLAELERIRLAEIAAEEARLEAIAQAERDRLAEIARKEKARLDAIAQAQADALGLPSLQQIMEKATVSAVNADSFVSLRLSPRGLRVGFPLLEPPCM